MRLNRRELKISQQPLKPGPLMRRYSQSPEHIKIVHTSTYLRIALSMCESSATITNGNCSRGCNTSTTNTNNFIVPTVIGNAFIFDCSNQSLRHVTCHQCLLKARYLSVKTTWSEKLISDISMSPFQAGFHAITGC